MGNVYNQGIGTLARKLQKGGKAEPVFEHGYTDTEINFNPFSKSSKGLLGVGRTFVEAFYPLRRERLQDKEIIRIPVNRPPNAQSVLDFISKETGKPLTKEDFFYSPRKGEHDVDFWSGKKLLPKDYRFVFDAEGNPNEGYLEITNPAVYGEAEYGLKYMPSVQILKKLPAGAKKTGQYIYDFLSDPETRTKAGENVTKVLEPINKKLGAIIYGQQDLLNNPGADYIEYEDGTRVGRHDVLLSLLTLLGTGATGSVIGGAGKAKAVSNSTTLRSFIGERDLTKIPDDMKINNITGKKFKDNLNEARIESDRINDLSMSQITEELEELGFKSLASMPDVLKIKVLQEYKIRKPLGWHIGPDGTKRYEVSDKNTSLDKDLAKSLVENPYITDKKLMDALSGTSIQDGITVLTRDLLKGSPVLKMYPELGKTRVLYESDLDSFGVFRRKDKGPDEIAVKINPKKYPQTFKSIILHELGHETQDFMRFAGGGSFETAGNINKGLESIYGKINVLETRLNLNKILEPSDSNRLAQLKAEASSVELLLKDWKKADLEFKKTGTKAAEEALEGESRKLYRALGGEIASRSIQRRDWLTAGERNILSPDINLGQIIVKELEDQGYKVELPFYSPKLEDSLKVTITASDKSNFLPSHVKDLKKQLEEIIKAERTPLYRKSPYDKEQERAKDKKFELLKIQNKTDKQNAEIDELNDVLNAGETMNRAALRTRGEGYNKDKLKIDLYGSDIPFDESIIKPELEEYLSSSLQAMEKAPRKENVVSFYHGFDSEIDPDEIEFRKSIFGKKPRGGKGVSITSDPKIARGYGSTVIEVPLDLNRYKIFDYNNSDHKKSITDAIKNDPDFVKKFTKDSISRLKPRNVVDFLEVNSKVRDPEKRAKLTKKQLFEELDFSRPDLTENSHIVDILQEKGFEGVKQFEKGKEQYKLYNLEREDLFLIKNQEQRAKDKASNKNLDLSVSAKTARSNTLNTYKKTIPIFKELNKGKQDLQTGLDYGSGLGLGADFLKFDSFDPYLGVKSNATYTDSKKIPSSSYGKITNFNVLNVLPKKNRDYVIKDIGRILKKEGHAIISVPDIDYVRKQTRGRKGSEERSIITDRGTYQKHFEPKELSDYIKKVLGKDFLVTTNPKKKIGDVSVIVKKFNRGGIVSRGTRPTVFSTGIPTALRRETNAKI